MNRDYITYIKINKPNKTEFAYQCKGQIIIFFFVLFAFEQQFCVRMIKMEYRAEEKYIRSKESGKIKEKRKKKILNLFKMLYKVYSIHHTEYRKSMS